MIPLIIFLLVIIVVLIVIINNLWNQNKQLENEIGSEYQYVDFSEQKVESIYSFILQKLIATKSELDRIDKRGSFSSDDEVGFAFKVINNSIELLVNELKLLKKEERDSER